MADRPPIVNIGENSPEQVAYKLFMHIVRCEHQDLTPNKNDQGATREWILDTFGECMKTVRDPFSRR